jgi:uncharacterized protein
MRTVRDYPQSGRCVRRSVRKPTVRRPRVPILAGRAAIVDFLRRKWERELDYALRKDLWAFSGNRIAVRFQYECRDASGQWWRSYGNEQWEFDEQGYMRRREASINDVRIEESDRRIAGSRPESERGASLPLCGVAGEPCAVMNGSYRAHPQATRPRAAK